MATPLSSKAAAATTDRSSTASELKAVYPSKRAFGPYEATLRSNEEMQSLSDELDHERTVELTAIETGLVSETPLHETLQELSFSRKTGTLGIRAGQDTGLLVLEAGVPQRAFFQDFTDEDAVLAMLALEEGRYTFAPGTGEDREGTIVKSVTALLLEDSRRRDEQTTRKVDFSESEPTQRLPRPDFKK